MYNFSKLLDNTNNVIFNEFVDTYTGCINLHDEEKFNTVISFYQRIINLMSSSFQIDKLTNIFEELAQYRMSISIPYVIMTNEIYGLKNLLLTKITDKQHNILELLHIFNHINNKIAKVYLFEYITKLTSSNTVRINSLTDLMEKNIISHYESHLVWLSNLALNYKK